MKLYVRFTIYIWINILLNNNMILNAGIYFSITVSLLQLIYILWTRKIANIICQPILSTKTFTEEIPDIYVITLRICHNYIDFSISVSNIQHSMLSFHKENTFLLNNKCQVILPKTMLEYFEIHSSFVSDVYMEDIPGIICQLHHLHLEKYFIQQQHYLYLRHKHVRIFGNSQ